MASEFLTADRGGFQLNPGLDAHLSGLRYRAYRHHHAEGPGSLLACARVRAIGKVVGVRGEGRR